MKLLPPPGPERTRQVRLLGGLAAILAVMVWYLFLRSSPADSQAAASNPVTTRPADANAPVVLPDPVKLTDLDPVLAQVDVGRNLFRFGVRPPPPPPPAPPPPPPRAPEPPPPPPPIPPVPLEGTGMYVDDRGQRWAVLKDMKSGAQLYASEGEVLDGKYKVLKVAEFSVIVAYLDGTGQRTITIR